MYDSDSDNSDLMPKVFAVDHMEEDLDLSVPPTSGQEYLRRVILEAKKCPPIVVADLGANVCSSRPATSIPINLGSKLLPAPCGYAPSLEWQKLQVSDFSEVRQRMVRYKVLAKKAGKTKRLPLKEDVNSWCKLCFGRLHILQKNDSCTESDSESNESSAVDKQLSNEDGTPPLLSIVTHMDQPTVVQVLEYHVNWFEKTGFTIEQARWFYALMVCLEKPLEPESCALLRDLARGCATLRATLDSAADERLPALNLLICLVARYFDQMDLGDNS